MNKDLISRYANEYGTLVERPTIDGNKMKSSCCWSFDYEN